MFLFTPFWVSLPSGHLEGFIKFISTLVDTGSGREKIGLRSVNEVRILGYIGGWEGGGRQQILDTRPDFFLELCYQAEHYHGVFKNFSHFNYVQSKVFDDVSCMA